MRGKEQNDKLTVLMWRNGRMPTIWDELRPPSHLADDNNIISVNRRECFYTIILYRKYFRRDCKVCTELTTASIIGRTLVAVRCILYYRMEYLLYMLFFSLVTTLYNHIILWSTLVCMLHVYHISPTSTTSHPRARHAFYII